VHVDLSRDGGATWTRIQSDVPLNGTSSAQIALVAPGPETAGARIRVSWARNPALQTTSGTFHLAEPFLRLITPVGRGNYPLCTAMAIEWAHNLGVNEHVHVEQSTDGGATWRTVAHDVANTGANRSTFWEWITTPETHAGVVRVTWSQDQTVAASVGSLVLGRDEGYDCDDD